MEETSIMCRQTTGIHPFDPNRKFVRVTGVNSRGFVEFEFSVGVPDMFVELALPAVAFDAFCIAQDVVRLEGETEPTTIRSKQ
jgi:phenol hydroxylase P0 protein